jgi:2-amino-4-hydroxy-6-hydroxymethyldihydropteridine diphosphokinase
MIPAFVALGSNLNNPLHQIQQAIVSLRELPHSVLETHSSFYRTPPWGKTDQADFINAVVKMKTYLTPDALITELQKIENQQGKQITEKWGPRTLDCDLILYGNAIIIDETLTIPHPRMKTRAFVMIPLMEIEPTLILPDGGAIQDCIKQCDTTGIEKIC